VFDIAFSEIVVIAVVALVVIGPERLPKVARTLGHMFGRLQRYVNEVKSDISREMELDELRKLQSEVQTAARELETSVSQAAQSVDAGVRSIESQLNDAGAPAPSGIGGTHAGTLGASAAVGAHTETPATSGTGGTHAETLATGTAAAETAANHAAASDAANPTSSDAPRQAALPGFDRI
jgi:sec-independent protein translocase protein TatB